MDISASTSVFLYSTAALSRRIFAFFTDLGMPGWTRSLSMIMPSMISGIIRHYIEGRFQLHAPRQTTEEFFEHVRDSSELQGMDQALLRGFLERADRVKFTDYLPSV